MDPYNRLADEAAYFGAQADGKHDAAAGVAAELRELAGDIGWVAETGVDGIVSVTTGTLCGWRNRLTEAADALAAPAPAAGEDGAQTDRRGDRSPRAGGYRR